MIVARSQNGITRLW